MQRLLAPRCMPKLCPVRLFGALQKRTLAAPSTRSKLSRVSVETRAFHNSYNVAFPDGSTTDSNPPFRPPFSAYTTWPPNVHTIFRSISPTGGANRYVGAYLKLLWLCFHPYGRYDYLIIPEPLPSESGEEVGFVVSLVTPDNALRPVLFMDVKDDTWVDREELRAKADEKMYERFEYYMFENGDSECPLPRVWGLSLLGTKLRVYRGDVESGEVMPPFEGGRGSGRRDFLEGGWGVDILEQKGFEKVKEIWGDIDEGTAAYWGERGGDSEEGTC